jgi:pseudaminic acid synthase
MIMALSIGVFVAFNQTFTIEDKKIGLNCPTYIIAEMSANHGQDLSRAKELVYAAKESGADAIKLQTYRADTLTMNSKQPHFYINEGPWKGQYLYDLYKGAYMPWDFHAELFTLANKLNLTCFSSPFDQSAINLLEQFDSPAYKIASPEIIDHDLIRAVAKTNKPLIMSTGGATLDEIAQAVKIVNDEGVEDFCLLKCTSTYPAPAKTINLKTMSHMADAFHCPVGLSDHTLGNSVPIAAVAMGACMIEKHFVMSKDDETADSFFSMTPDELVDLVNGIRQVEQAIGQVHYVTEPSNGRRCLYALRDITIGENFTRENTVNLRPGGGELMPKDLAFVLGRVATVNIASGEQLSWNMVGATN